MTFARDDTSGPNPMAMFPTRTGDAVSGHLYPGSRPRAAKGRRFTWPSRTASKPLPPAVGRREAGGQVPYRPIRIPAGRFLYCTDPGGNSIGLFGAKAA